MLAGLGVLVMSWYSLHHCRVMSIAAKSTGQWFSAAFVHLSSFKKDLNHKTHLIVQSRMQVNWNLSFTQNLFNL